MASPARLAISLCQYRATVSAVVQRRQDTRESFSRDDAVR